MRNILTTEQIAKFLILMEKFKSNQEFSVFNLWNIKKLNKQELTEKTQRFAETLQNDGKSESDSEKLGAANEDKNQKNNDKESDNDIDMALPNDDDDIHKTIEECHKQKIAKNMSLNSLTSSQVQKLNRSIDSKTQLIP